MDLRCIARRHCCTAQSLPEWISILLSFQTVCCFLEPLHLPGSKINQFWEKPMNGLLVKPKARIESQFTEFLDDHQDYPSGHNHVSKRDNPPFHPKGTFSCTATLKNDGEGVIIGYLQDAPEFCVFKDHMTIPVPFPLDLRLFTITEERLPNKGYYAVSLEQGDGDPLMNDSIKMALWEYDEKNTLWLRLDSVFIKNGAQIELKNIDGYFYVFSLSGEPAGEQQISIYLIFDSKFFSVQTLTISNIHHFAVWHEPNDNNVFLGIVSEISDAQLSSRLYIYQWTDNYFALFDIISLMSVNTIKPFVVNAVLFLGVCHSSDVTGAENYATLFKYIEESKAFILHQKISVSDCWNIEYLNFKTDEDNLLSEHFLIFTRSEKHETSGLSRPTSSAVYKFFNNYFYPFQVISLSNVKKWLVCNGCVDSSFFLAVTEYSGVHLFNYDGWIFSELTTCLESSKLNQASLLMVHDLSLVLVVADSKNDGTRPNVFQLLSDDIEIYEQIERTFDEWRSGFEEQLRKVSKLDHLSKRIQSAPKANALEVIINGSIEFSSFNDNTTLNLQSPQSFENYEKSDSFAENLHSKIAEIRILDSFVDKLFSSNGQFFINGDLFLNEFTANCPEECDLNVLSISNLNGEDFDKLVANTVNTEISNDYGGSLDFENIAVSLHLSSKHINGHPMGSLIHKKRNISFQNGLKANSVVISEGINVIGRIDDVKIDPESVVMISSSQILNGSLIFKDGRIDYLNLNKSLIQDQQMCFNPEDI